MDVKIDTKEKFTVITPNKDSFTENMSDKLIALLSSYLQKDMPHLIVNMQNIISISEANAQALLNLQQQFQEHQYSFVLCSIQPAVNAFLDQMDLLDFLNSTPSESEAWDIVQMEEIERELMNGLED
jgi:anti-anti-sigma factor